MNDYRKSKFKRKESTINRRCFMKSAALAAISCYTLNLAEQASAQTKEEVKPPFAKWTVGPYLQNPSATAMTICFVSDYAQDVSAVVKPLTGTGKVSQTVVATTIPGTTATVWKIRLTNLKAAAEYIYQVNYTADAKPVIGPAYRFKTSSPDADSASGLVVNDVHNRTGTVEALMKHVRADDYEFSILLGDCWNDPSWHGDGKGIMTTLDAFVRLLNAHEKPMLYVRGNHECRGYFSGKMGYLFDLPNLDQAASYYEQNYYYSYTNGPLYLLFNDAGEDGDKRIDKFTPYRKRQTEWLTEEIKKPAYRNAKHHVFASHIPLYNVNYWKAKYCQEFWSPVLDKADIDLALGAHDHQWRILEKNAECVNAECDSFKKTANCTHSPPYPQFIGGGPSVQQGTVMLLKADAIGLSIRMLNTKGKTLAKIKYKNK